MRHVPGFLSPGLQTTFLSSASLPQRATLLYDFLPSPCCVFFFPGDFKEPPAVYWLPSILSALTIFLTPNTSGTSRIQTNPSGNHQPWPRSPAVTAFPLSACCGGLPGWGSLLSAGGVFCCLKGGGSKSSLSQNSSFREVAEGSPRGTVDFSQGGQAE